tara:strand:+ start:264 stop:458 length:195 start_codon:yes stop_codon:yes gene_type:complete
LTTKLEVILHANSILKGHLNSASTVAMDAGACYGTEEGILTLTGGAGSCGEVRTTIPLETRCNP